MYCPVCKTEIEDDIELCPVCGRKFNKSDKSQWVILGTIEDKFSADFAKETLTSYNIPVVIFSKSGFFGNVGLTLNPFYKASTATFEISVLKDDIEEAVEVLNMILNEKWQKKE